MSLLVFGSTNIDLVMLPGQLPGRGETVLCENYQLVPGGKGANQALAARRAGAEVTFVSAVGCDPNGQIALANLSRDGVNLQHIKRAGQPTGCAVVLVEKSGENAICVASGANQEVSACQISDQLLKESALIVLQQEISVDQNLALALRAKQAGIPILYNLAPAQALPTTLFEAVDFLVVNKVEATLLAGAKTNLPPERVAKALAKTYDLTAIITLGGAGVVAASSEVYTQLPASKVDVVDTTGAGDTFTGYLAAALADNCDLEIALKRASNAASIACTSAGAQAAIPYAR